MENGRKYVLKAPNGEYFKRFSFSDGIQLVSNKIMATSFQDGEAVSWVHSLADAGMLTREYLPEVRYGVMIRYQDSYPGKTVIKYLCEQPLWPDEGYVLIQSPNSEFPIVTWPTVADIPFKVSSVGFAGYDRLIAVEVVDGKVEGGS